MERTTHILDIQLSTLTMAKKANISEIDGVTMSPIEIFQRMNHLATEALEKLAGWARMSETQQSNEGTSIVAELQSICNMIEFWKTCGKQNFLKRVPNVHFLEEADKKIIERLLQVFESHIEIACGDDFWEMLNALVTVQQHPSHESEMAKQSTVICLEGTADKNKKFIKLSLGRGRLKERKLERWNKKWLAKLEVGAQTKMMAQNKDAKVTNAAQRPHPNSGSAKANEKVVHGTQTLGNTDKNQKKAAQKKRDAKVTNTAQRPHPNTTNVHGTQTIDDLYNKPPYPEFKYMMCPLCTVSYHIPQRLVDHFAYVSDDEGSRKLDDSKSIPAGKDFWGGNVTGITDFPQLKKMRNHIKEHILDTGGDLKMELPPFFRDRREAKEQE